MSSDHDFDSELEQDENRDQASTPRMGEANRTEDENTHDCTQNSVHRTDGAVPHHVRGVEKGHSWASLGRGINPPSRSPS